MTESPRPTLAWACFGAGARRPRAKVVAAWHLSLPDSCHSFDSWLFSSFPLLTLGILVLATNHSPAADPTPAQKLVPRGGRADHRPSGQLQRRPGKHAAGVSSRRSMRRPISSSSTISTRPTACRSSFTTKSSTARPMPSSCFGKRRPGGRRFFGGRAAKAGCRPLVRRQSSPARSCRRWPNRST